MWIDAAGKSRHTGIRTYEAMFIDEKCELKKRENGWLPDPGHQRVFFVMGFRCLTRVPEYDCPHRTIPFRNAEPRHDFLIVVGHFCPVSYTHLRAHETGRNL